MDTLLCDPLADILAASLSEKFAVLPEKDGSCAVATPFRYPDLASVEISVHRVAEGYTVSDDGETLNILFVNGLTLTRSIRKEIQAIARSHGIRFEKETLFITVPTESEIGDATTRLLNAIQAVGYLLYKRRHRTTPAFQDIVEEHLIVNRIRYQTGHLVIGKTRQHSLKFFVNSGRNIGIEPLTARTLQSARNKAERMAFKYMDIRRGNPTTHYRLLAVLDTRGRRAEVWQDPDAFRPIEEYTDGFFRWPEDKDEIITTLA